MTMPQLIRALRGALSQEQFAELAGHSQTWVSYVESGRTRASFTDLERVATALHVDITFEPGAGWSFVPSVNGTA